MSPRRLAATAVLACLVLGGGACGIPEGTATPIDDKDLPAALRGTSTTTTPSSPTGSPSDVSVYWIRERRLVPESISFEKAPSVDRLLSLLERGPGSGAGTGTRSLVSQDDVVTGAERDGALVSVDLAPAFSQVAGPDQALALGQIVATLTTIPGVEGVSFRQSGEPVEVPIADGTVVKRPLGRPDVVPLINPSGPPAGSPPPGP